MPVKNNKNKKSLGYYFLIMWIVFLYVVAYYCLYNMHGIREMRATKTTVVVPADFKERLHFHGLDKEISVIERGPDKLYFVRSGKKCVF